MYIRLAADNPFCIAGRNSPSIHRCYPIAQSCPARSPPLEVCITLLEECGDALLLVLCAVNGTDEKRLELEPGCQIHLHASVHGALDERKAERRTLLIDLHHALGFGECTALGCQAIDEADAMRLFRRDGFSCEQDLQRFRCADNAWQPLRAAGARNRADTGAGDGIDRAFGSDADIAGERQL